jgi:hypothetical protein
MWAYSKSFLPIKYGQNILKRRILICTIALHLLCPAVRTIAKAEQIRIDLAKELLIRGRKELLKETRQTF